MSATLSATNIAGNLKQIREKMQRAAGEASRKADDVNLIAVSKTQDVAAILEAINAGQTVFGENRVQEAAAKFPGLKQEFPNVRLHLIGPLQSNKVKEAVALCDAIHTLDRESLALALVRECEKQGRAPQIFVQVNTGEEPQKSGVLPADVDAFISRCRKEWQIPVFGLMCIPPVDDIPAPHFAFLRQLTERNGLTGLSMGMSHDFTQAILLGATHIRVGSAIFGERAKV